MKVLPAEPRRVAVPSVAADGWTLNLFSEAPTKPVRFQYSHATAPVGREPREWQVIDSDEFRTNASLKKDAVAILDFVLPLHWGTK